jgi:hypothetical protein
MRPLVILSLLLVVAELKADDVSRLCGEASTFIRALQKTSDHLDGWEVYIPPLQQYMLRCNTLITAQVCYE